MKDGECHTLAGVWIEADSRRSWAQEHPVTPSRVCGLKHLSPLPNNTNL